MTYASFAHDDWGPSIPPIVGKIAIAFGQLEHILKLAYKRTMGQTCAEAMDFADKLSSNHSLAKKLSDKFAIRALDQHQEAMMDKIIARIVDVNRRRNFLIHGYWHRRISDGALLVTKKGYGTRQINLADTQLFEDLLTEIVTIRDALNVFTKRPPARSA